MYPLTSALHTHHIFSPQVPILEDLIEPCIFEHENEELIRVPTEEEIRKAPDGMPGLFYKHYWSTAVQSFFRKGCPIK